MKRLLSLSLLLSAAAIHAQSFEWDKPAPAPHPKEVQLSSSMQEKQPATPQDGYAGIYAPEADGTPTAYGEVYRAGEMTGSHPALPLGTLLRVTNMENGRSVVVRVTDRGRECDDCVVMISDIAADQLGMDDKSKVTVKPDGFSNWNPAPRQTVDLTPPPAPAAAAPQVAASEPEVEKEQPRPSVFTREVVSPAPAPSIADAPAGEPEMYRSEVVAPPPTVASARQARGVEAAEPPVGERFTVQLAAYNNETYAVNRVNELKELGLDGAYFQAVSKDGGEVINRVFAGTYDNVVDAQAAAREIAAKYKINGIVAKK